MDASSTLKGIRLVPVVVIEEVDSAVPLARTLRDAGIGALEVTLRTDCALDAIESIARAVPDLVLGAGSVRQSQQLGQVKNVGARFAVSPGATAQLLETAADVGLPFVPGAVTASEMMALLEQGYQLQKFFPAELCGGAAALQALAAPLPELRFFPTGGISAALAPGYLALDTVFCVGGSWFVPGDLLRARSFAAIGDLAREAVRLTA